LDWNVVERQERLSSEVWQQLLSVVVGFEEPCKVLVYGQVPEMNLGIQVEWIGVCGQHRTCYSGPSKVLFRAIETRDAQASMAFVSYRFPQMCAIGVGGAFIVGQTF
jgi:hypothetical protein